MKEIFIEKKFSKGSLDVINKANKLIASYRAQGYSLTLRQLYYQFVARDLIPNNMNSYKRLGNIINDGRLAGMIDWNAITDRTRSLTKSPAWTSPAEILNSAIEQYRIDRWAGSPVYVEVWVEKDALSDVVEQACASYDIPSFACRGYVSQSAMYEAAQRIIEKADDFERMTGAVQEAYIIHLGDHDPSGIDMTRDIQDRLSLFNAYVEIDRIALNMDQVDQYNPPPNPAKLTDSRVGGYISQFGNSSWELDALEPSVITNLVQRKITFYMDEEIRDKHIAQEKAQRKEMREKVGNIEFKEYNDNSYGDDE
jgi:hypothetical protein